MARHTSSEAPYRGIAAEIRARIRVGTLRPGDRVPSARQITREWGVAIATATKVLAALRAEGLVRAVPGVGTVVAPDAAPDPAQEQRATRRRRALGAEQELSRGRLVRAAVAVADAEGLAALSMRRMAGELDTATMSLYQHVSSKEELIRHMVEAAIGEVRFPDPLPADWRARLRLAAQQQWLVYCRHPWLPQVVSLTRPPIGSAIMAHAEWIMGALDNLGLDAGTLLHIQATLSNYVRGTAIHLEQEFRLKQATGLSDDQWRHSESTRAAVATVLASSPLPRLTGLIGRQDIQFNLDTLFDFGLERLLDGIGTLIERGPAQRVFGSAS